MKITTFTGHRPQSLGPWHEYPDIFAKLVTLAGTVIDKYNVEYGVSGMALGWDMAVAMQLTDKDIPWTAAVPMKGQPGRWRETQKQLYFALLKKATNVIYVDELPDYAVGTPGEYLAKKLFVRDYYMVDQSDNIIALWNGVKQGGTYHTVQYAERNNKPIINVWEQWKNL